MAFRSLFALPPPSPSHARVSQRWFSTLFAPPPLLSHATATQRRNIWAFELVRTPTSSLVCNSELEEVFHGLLTLFATPRVQL